MKKGLIATAISLFLTMTIVHSEVSIALLNFLLAGVVPGTKIILPFWAMLAIYCLMITTIVTIYVESMIAVAKQRKSAKATRQTLPRRRYGNA